MNVGGPEAHGDLRPTMKLSGHDWVGKLTDKIWAPRISFSKSQTS